MNEPASNGARVKRPLAIDLFCGLGGWTEGLLAEGWRVIGYDIERHAYGEHRYPAQLVLQDVRTIDGAQFANASLIVASSPCQEFSYRAMPWKRAKSLGSPLLGMELFAQAERIQREAIAAAGHFIPMVQENVRGAQKYVGRARWHYGSFYLWGDVPALMPITMGRTAMKVGVAHRSSSETNFHGYNRFMADDLTVRRAVKEGRLTPEQGEAAKAILFPEDDSVKVGGSRGDDWFTHHNRPEFEDRATKNDGGSWFNVAHNTASGKGRNPVHREISRAWRDKHYDDTAKAQLHDDGVKQAGISGERDNGKGDRWFQDGAAASGSKSSARKAASARIAKIPLPLARHIARVYLPREP